MFMQFNLYTSYLWPISVLNWDFSVLPFDLSLHRGLVFSNRFNFKINVHWACPHIPNRQLLSYLAFFACSFLSHFCESDLNFFLDRELCLVPIYSCIILCWRRDGPRLHGRRWESIVKVASWNIFTGFWQNLVGKSKLLNRVVEKSLFLFQSAAILEVLHCVLGLVRSSVIITLLQGIGLLNSRLVSKFCSRTGIFLAMKVSKAPIKVTSRLFLVWGVLGPVPRTHNSPGFILLLTAWSITEVLRYRYGIQC